MTASKNSEQTPFYEEKPYKNNLNQMFYQQFTNQKVLQNLYKESYQELLKVNRALEKTQKQIVQLTRNNTGNNSEIDYDEGVLNPEISTLIKKYKDLLLSDKGQMMIRRTKSSRQRTDQQVKRLSQQEYIFEKNTARQQFNKFLQNFQADYQQESFQFEIFKTIAKTIGPEINYAIFLPTTMKVVLAGINWIDKDNGNASIALKIQIKVHVPGFNNYPNIFEQVMKNKFKISIKTQCYSFLKNKKVGLKQKNQRQNKQDKTYICKGNDIFNDNISSEFFSSAFQFFKQKYKWKNYYKPDDKLLKKAKDFQGFIISYSINNINVAVSKVDKNSPLELLDLNGIVQIEPITTSMKQWSSILFNKNNKIRTYFQQMSPKVTIKFNLISLQQNWTQIQPSKILLFNQIYSFDQVQKDDYKLAERLMFLQVSNERKSKYKLQRSFTRNYIWKKTSHEEIKPMMKIEYLSKRPKEQPKQEQPQLLKGILSKVKQLDKLKGDNSKKIKEIENFLMDLSRIIGKHEMVGDKESENVIERMIKHLQQLQDGLYELQQQVKELKKEKHQKHYRRFAINYIRKLRLKLRNITNFYMEELLPFKKIKKNSKQYKQINNYLNNELMQKKQGFEVKQKKIDSDYNQSNALFHFPLYKPPGHSLWLIFISNFVLSILNIAIFFQQPSLSSRIASLTTLMLSFVGMISIVQKEMRNLLTQRIFYLMFFTPIICLVHSFFIPLKTKQHQISSIVFKSLSFYIVLMATLISIGYIAFYYYLFTKYQQKEYNLNLRFVKQTEALYLVLPGSKQADKILGQKDKDKKIKMKKKFYRVLFSIMIRHINKLYQIRSKLKDETILGSEIKYKELGDKLKQNKKKSMHFITNMFEFSHQIQSPTKNKQNNICNVRKSQEQDKKVTFKLDDNKFNAIKDS